MEGAARADDGAHRDRRQHQLELSVLAGLSGPNRVVITATNSFAQRFHTVFPDAFIKAMTAPEADADKNGRISLLEAFTLCVASGGAALRAGRTTCRPRPR